YRARIADPKDAGMLLMSLAIGLIMGTGMVVLALFACGFVFGIVWLLESLEPDDRTQFDLTVESKNRMRVRRQVYQALRHEGVRFGLAESNGTELRYQVSVPFNQRLNKLTKAIRNLDKHESLIVDWHLKKPRVVQT